MGALPLCKCTVCFFANSCQLFTRFSIRPSGIRSLRGAGLKPAPNRSVTGELQLCGLCKHETGSRSTAEQPPATAQRSIDERKCGKKGKKMENPCKGKAGSRRQSGSHQCSLPLTRVPSPGAGRMGSPRPEQKGVEQRCPLVIPFHLMGTRRRARR